MLNNTINHLVDYHNNIFFWLIFIFMPLMVIIIRISQKGKDCKVLTKYRNGLFSSFSGKFLNDFGFPLIFSTDRKLGAIIHRFFF